MHEQPRACSTRRRRAAPLNAPLSFPPLSLSSSCLSAPPRQCLIEKGGYKYLDVRPTLELDAVRGAQWPLLPPHAVHAVVPSAPPRMQPHPRSSDTRSAPPPALLVQAGKFKGCVNVPIVNASWKYNAAEKKKEVVKEDNMDFVAMVSRSEPSISWPACCWAAGERGSARGRAARVPQQGAPSAPPTPTLARSH